jgi:hypothetical protein
VVDVVGVESNEELPAIRTPQDGGGGAPDMQIARALHRLNPAIGLWIISAPACESRAFPAVASIVHEWLLACPTDNDGLISGYQHLKQAWVAAGAGGAAHGKSDSPSNDGAIAPTVYLLSEDYAQAALVHKRLRKAAREFLGTDLALAGAGPIHKVAVEPIRVLTVPCAGPEDAIWAAVLDELCPIVEGEESFPPTEIETALEHVESRAAEVAHHSAAAASSAWDHLAQVLDPEEREALAADFAEPGIPVATPRRRAEPAPAEAEIQIPVFRNPAPPAPAVKSPAVPAPASQPVESRPTRMEARPAAVPAPAPAHSLRAFDLARLDRASQWQAVERSVLDLAPQSILLDARPPMSWASETCISIDARGGLNVWTLYKDGASWFALREWAQEHRNLLALTRRDLVIDLEAEVMVHMALPLEESQSENPVHPQRHDGVAATIMRTPAKNVRLYRLRILDWNGRQGIVVVPIA